MKTIKIQGVSTIEDSELAKMFGLSVRRIRCIIKMHEIRFTDEFVLSINSKLYFTMKGVCLLSFYIDQAEAIEVGVQIIRTFAEVQSIYNKPKRLSKSIKRTERNGNLGYMELYRTIKQMTGEMYITEATPVSIITSDNSIN